MNLFTFFVGLLEPISKLFNKYGIIKSLGYIFIVAMMVFFGYTCYCIINLDDRIDASVTRALTEQTEANTQVHSDGIEKRMKNIETINSLIKETMYEVGADRTSIIEMHNGTNNTAGLPFLYGEMTYEQVRQGIEHVDDNYVKVNLTRYLFPLILSQKSFFKGDMKDVAMLDDKIASKMAGDGTTYIVVYELYGKDSAIGYFSVTWNGNENPNLTNDDITKISVTAQKISTLLDTK